MDAPQLEARIGTERLRLRAPGMGDAWRIADLINDFEIARMTTRIPHPYRLADAQAFLARFGEHALADEPVFAVEHPAFGLIGMIGFHRQDAPYPEVGYWFGRTFWGQGFASEALIAALGWARNAWGRRAITSGHFTDNLASGRVLMKAGFLYTGEVQWRESLARGAAVPTRMMVWLA